MRPDNLVEVSYEVANKVGGIYQVLSSKAGKMQDFYGDNYLTIGYYDEEKARNDFIAREVQGLDFLDELEEEEGIKCYVGVWDIPSSPQTLLIDPSEMDKTADQIKEELWRDKGIDSLTAGGDFDDPIKWSYAVGKVLNRIEKEWEGETVYHLHEWLSGPAIFQVDAPTVFTTHATVLGRALSNSDYDLEAAVDEGHVDDERAEEFGVKPKHQVEKEAAKSADVFTTVSKNTGEEAAAVLDTEPDKILPNGFNVEEFPSLEELSYQHKEKKEEMREFLRAYFEPYYSVELEKDPRVLFISGRYEFHNKGLDVFADALAEVNEMPGDDFFVFFFVPSDTSGPKRELLDNMALYEELEDYVDSVVPELRSKILDSVTAGEKPGDLEETVDSSTLKSLQRNFHSRKSGNPPLCAFDLNYENDNIIQRLKKRGLNNSEDDRVKVVFYPTYLSVGDRLLSMSYNDAIVASSAGIFPSYYEPWGYTPVETAANGALSVTTDMAGFGHFLMDKTSEDERKGIKVLRRRNFSDEEAAQNLADMIQEITEYSKTEITERKHNARRLAQMTSWEKLGDNYLEAHKKAVENSQ